MRTNHNIVEINLPMLVAESILDPATRVLHQVGETTDPRSKQRLVVLNVTCFLAFPSNATTPDYRILVKRDRSKGNYAGGSERCGAEGFGEQS
jgi:hypothetical protein